MFTGIKDNLRDVAEHSNWNSVICVYKFGVRIGMFI